jgi:hypothetical protein
VREVTDWGPGPVDPYAGQPAAPVPAYNPYVNPGSWEPARYLPRATVPGPLLAGTILGYLVAAFLFLSGMFLLFFGSLLGSFAGADSTFTNGGTTLVVAGLGNWVALGLFVSGGIVATLRRPVGLVLEAVASALVVVLAVYWIVAYPHADIVFWAIVHVVIALVPAGLILLPPANRAWVAGQSRPLPPAAPPPFPTDQWGRPFGT